MFYRKFMPNAVFLFVKKKPSGINLEGQYSGLYNTDYTFN